MPKELQFNAEEYARTYGDNAYIYVKPCKETAFGKIANKLIAAYARSPIYRVTTAALLAPLIVFSGAYKVVLPLLCFIIVWRAWPLILGGVAGAAVLDALVHRDE